MGRGFKDFEEDKNKWIVYYGDITEKLNIVKFKYKEEQNLFPVRVFERGSETFHGRTPLVVF